MLRIIYLPGEPFENGLKHGIELKSEIHEFLKKDMEVNSRIFKLPSGSTPYDIAGDYAHFVKTESEEIWADVCGLSKGAGLSIEEVLYIQYRREIQKKCTKSIFQDCSLFAINHNDFGAILGQTIDLEAYIKKFGVILKTGGFENSPAHIQYSFAGLLGYAGMNVDGLCVGINMVNGGEWGEGLSPYLLVSLLLKTNCIIEAAKLISNYKCSSSRSITVLKDQEVVCYEILPPHINHISDLPLIHTNHFIHPDSIKHEKLNVILKKNSLQRYNLLKIITNEIQDKSVSEIFGQISGHNGDTADRICIPSHGKLNINETVASILMVPNANEFYVRKGGLSEGKLVKINI